MRLLIKHALICTHFQKSEHWIKPGLKFHKSEKLSTARKGKKRKMFTTLFRNKLLYKIRPMMSKPL